MTEQTEQAAETKTVIRPNLKNYVRAKSGSGKRSHRTDDFVARTLDGKTLDAIKSGAALLGVDVAKWEKLNPGQQRMLIGNALRHRLVDAKAPLSEQAITDVFGQPVEPYDAEAAAAAAAAKAAEQGPEGEATATEEAPAGKRRSRK